MQTIIHKVYLPQSAEETWHWRGGEGRTIMCMIDMGKFAFIFSREATLELALLVLVSLSVSHTFS